MANKTSVSTVEATDRIPHANARSELCHAGESSAGRATGDRPMLNRAAHNAGETTRRQANRASGLSCNCPRYSLRVARMERSEIRGMNDIPTAPLYASSKALPLVRPMIAASLTAQQTSSAIIWRQKSLSIGRLISGVDRRKTRVAINCWKPAYTRYEAAASPEIPDFASLHPRYDCLAPSHPVPQHKARPSCAADAVAEIVGFGPCIGADSHLIKQMGAAGAHQRAQQARVLIADHGA